VETSLSLTMQIF